MILTPSAEMSMLLYIMQANEWLHDKVPNAKIPNAIILNLLPFIIPFNSPITN